MEQQTFAENFKELTTRALIAHFANYMGPEDLLTDVRTDRRVYFELGINDLNETAVESVTEKDGDLEVVFTGWNDHAETVTLTYKQENTTVMNIVMDRLFNK